MVQYVQKKTCVQIKYKFRSFIDIFFNSESKEEKKKQPNENETNDKKAGENLIGKENVEIGSVKFAIVWQYFKSCSIVLSLLFMIFSLIGSLINVYRNIFISTWTDVETPTNSSNTTSTRYSDIGIYAGTGLLQCNYDKYII